tara:strand:- start:10613 stop:11677 length:1065 start_codon:yes stop_codon:yes gene_type:complete
METDRPSEPDGEQHVSISLVMPNYNHSQYLHKSVGGMLAQLRPADEIIIIDDASTDNSLKILEAFAGQNANIRLIKRQTRLGAVANLNAGLAEAKGELIAFPGADDHISPTFLRDTAALMALHPFAGFASSSVEIRDENDKLTGARPILYPTTHPAFVSADQFRRMLSGSDNHFLGAATLYRRDALLTVGGFDASLGPMCDGVSARRLAARHGFCFTPGPLGMWRVHGKNYSLAMISAPESTAQIITRLKSVIDAEPEGIFPHDYAELLVKRLRFGIGRIIADDISDEPQVSLDRIADLAGGREIDHFALKLIRWSGPAKRVGAKIWLTLRLRPFSLIRIFLEPLRRKIFVRRD